MSLADIFKSKYGRYAVSYLTVFVTAAWIGGVTIALVVVVSLLTGYLIQFYVIRSIVGSISGKRANTRTVVMGGCAVILGAMLVLSGFWAPLAMSAGAWFVMDAVMLRYR